MPSQKTVVTEDAQLKTQMDQNITQFENYLSEIDREGVDRLLAFIRGSDFYSAPASTRFHNCHEGGLLEHTLNVINSLLAMGEQPMWAEAFQDISRESLIVIGALHDLCKAEYYAKEPKNKKVYSDSGKKWDSNGYFDWVTVMGYTVDDKVPYGHGEKSVMMTEEFVKLLPVERYAIRWHMGFTEPKETWNTLGTAIRKYPIVLAVHVADLYATYMLEQEE